MIVGLACCSVLCCGVDAWAQVSAQRSGSVVAVSPVVMPQLQSGSTILYDQTDGATPPLGASAQQLFGSPGTLDTLAADDLVISDKAGWLVSQVNFVIATDNGKNPAATAATVHIVGDTPGAPSDKAPLCQANDVVPTFNDAGNVMSVSFASACQLPPGHYWIELQALSNFNVNGNFVWEARRSQSNDAAMWRNPGSGFPGGPACPNWASFASCQIAANSAGHVVAPDLLFQVLGVRGVDPPPPLPAVSSWMLMLLGIGLGLFAIRRLARD